MDNLRKMREKYGLSQEKFAKKFLLSQQSIHKYENGLAEPDISRLIEFADYFDTTVDYLIGHTNDPKRPELLYESQLSPDEGILVQRYRKISGDLQKSILTIVRECSQNSEQETPDYDDNDPDPGC